MCGHTLWNEKDDDDIIKMRDEGNMPWKEIARVVKHSDSACKTELSRLKMAARVHNNALKKGEPGSAPLTARERVLLRLAKVEPFDVVASASSGSLAPVLRPIVPRPAPN